MGFGFGLLASAFRAVGFGFRVQGLGFAGRGTGKTSEYLAIGTKRKNREDSRTTPNPNPSYLTLDPKSHR